MYTHMCTAAPLCPLQPWMRRAGAATLPLWCRTMRTLSGTTWCVDYYCMIVHVHVLYIHVHVQYRCMFVHTMYTVAANYSVHVHCMPVWALYEIQSRGCICTDSCTVRVHVHTEVHVNISQRDKPKQLHTPEDRDFFQDKLPQAGLEPTTHCILCRCSTS